MCDREKIHKSSASHWYLNLRYTCCTVVSSCSHIIYTMRQVRLFNFKVVNLLLLLLSSTTSSLNGSNTFQRSWMSWKHCSGCRHNPREMSVKQCPHYSRWRCTDSGWLLPVSADSYFTDTVANRSITLAPFDRATCSRAHSHNLSHIRKHTRDKSTSGSVITRWMYHSLS
jgi:hypothetical protein